jgi:hypothetical protein
MSEQVVTPTTAPAPAPALPRRGDILFLVIQEYNCTATQAEIWLNQLFGAGK